jgi:hypothetical protein
MRTILFAIGLVATGFLASVFLVDWEEPLPPVHPSVEPICAEAMRRSGPDLSWVVQGREEKIRDREIRTVTLGELLAHNGKLVRVAGVLHAEFEWVALYPARSAMEREPWRAPWVSLDSLWPGEPHWYTKGPSISDRCAVVEGTYSSGAAGHGAMFNGTLRDVLRLDVWAAPHRPFVTMPPLLPPPR